MEFKGSYDEAQLLMRLVRAYQAAQDVMMHTGILMDAYKLRKQGTENLDSDMVIALAARLDKGS